MADDGDQRDGGATGRWLLGAVAAIAALAAGLGVMTLVSRSHGEESAGPITTALSSGTGAAGERTGAGVGDATASVPEPSRCHRSADGAAWELVFSDDFDGAELDTDAWYPYDSEGNAGFGLRRPAAITVEDGLLVITASMIDGQLVSGGMAHLEDQVYGRWEVRVRTDPDPSAATSGVVLTWPQSGDWPIDGENNIYETGPLPARNDVHSFVHYGADNQQEIIRHTMDGTQWHEVAMEWTADRIAFFVDGEPSGTVTNPEAIPHVAHHATIQLDAWRDDMGEPVTMMVDWIRVYRVDNAGACADG